MPFCTETDIYDYGVPRGAAPNPGRVVSSLVSSVFTLGEHGFETDQRIAFRPSGAGVLPAQLTANVEVFAIRLDAQRFQVAFAASGPVEIIDDPTDPLLVYAPLPIAESIAYAEAVVIQALPHHAVPIEGATPTTIPHILRSTTAELAASKLLARTGSSNESLSVTEDRARQRLERWATKHAPLRGDNLPANNDLSQSLAAGAIDFRGWCKYGGL